MTVFSASTIQCYRNDRLLLQNISFSLAEGCGLMITGANGAGKSTLLRIVSGLLLPDSGEVQWRSENIKCSLDFRQNSYYLGHKIALKQGLTVRENLFYSQRLYGQHVNLECLELFGLTAMQNTLTLHLSAGQKQRLALACVIAAKVKVWILDEPLTALDAAGQQLFQTLLSTHLQQQGIALIASHQLMSLPNLAVLKLIPAGAGIRVAS